MRLLEFFMWFDPQSTREGIADFVAGNPQEMPLPEYVAAITKWSEPRRKDWFAYQMNVPEAQRAIVASLAERPGRRLRGGRHRADDGRVRGSRRHACRLRRRRRGHLSGAALVLLRRHRPGPRLGAITASDAMIDKALPVFAAAGKERVPA